MPIIVGGGARRRPRSAGHLSSTVRLPVAVVHRPCRSPVRGRRRRGQHRGMTSPLFVTRDETLLDELLRLAAAAGVTPDVAHDGVAALRGWTRRVAGAGRCRRRRRGGAHAARRDATACTSSPGARCRPTCSGPRWRSAPRTSPSCPGSGRLGGRVAHRRRRRPARPAALTLGVVGGSGGAGRRRSRARSASSPPAPGPPSWSTSTRSARASTGCSGSRPPTGSAGTSSARPPGGSAPARCARRCRVGSGSAC